MINSLTGFGRASGDVGGKQLSVEIRALNSKALDLTVKLPLFFKEMEAPIRKLIGGRLLRGKVDLYVSIDQMGEDSPVKIDHALLAHYAKELKAVSDEIGIGHDGILQSAMSLPNVISNATKLEDGEKEQLTALATKAAESLLIYREKEGAPMEKDFRTRIATILELLEAAKIRVPIRKESVRIRLKSNLDSLVEQKDIDANRFEQELIYYLEKLDINEEIVRLESNCNLFLDAMDESINQCGKKLGFIAQEIGREINTTGAKANDKELQSIVVKMKDELEKIKEQVLNVL
ncbi:YicC family protein [Chitinophagales bacterium]|nr:YicC family protein [Chitinophagales bacterium]